MVESELHNNHSARYFPELQNVTSRIIFNIYRDEWLDFWSQIGK